MTLGGSIPMKRFGWNVYTSNSPRNLFNTIIRVAWPNEDIQRIIVLVSDTSASPMDMVFVLVINTQFYSK